MTNSNFNDWYNNNISKGVPVNPEIAVVNDNDVAKGSLGGKTKTEVDPDTGKKD